MSIGLFIARRLLLTIPLLIGVTLISFVLAHVGAPDFDGQNIMSPGVDPTLPFFSEGQIFNMHRHPSSMVNALFNAHPGRPLLACPGDATPDCPATRRRLWPDGSLPANDQ